MKNLGRLLMLATLAMQLSLTGCKDEKEDISQSPPPAASKGQITPVGEPDGEKVEKTIGAAGGEIQSTDGRIKVTIPAGALNDDIAIGIEPITNHCPMSSGPQAFRLTPHGQQFTVPATITIHYTDADMKGTLPEALGIAYQNEENIWMVAAARSIDTVAKTVSVPTTHFSDWSFITTLKLVEHEVWLDPGQSTSFKVRTLHYDDFDDLLAPLVPGQEIPIDPEDLPDPDLIGSWTLSGAGSLQGSGHTAVYTAPGQIPLSNPAIITVHIKSKGKAIGMLIGRAYTVVEGVAVSYDNGPFKIYKNAGANVTAGISMIDAGTASDNVKLVWQGNKPGIYNWTTTTVSFINHFGSTQVHSLYGTSNPPQVSGGALEITEIMEVGGYVVGTFTITPAGRYEITVPPKITTHGVVKGVFFVKRLS